MKYKRSSSKHSYLLECDTSAKIDSTYYLISSIYFKSKYLDKIILGYLREDEVNLNSGRFVNFTRIPQEHELQIDIESSLITTLESTEKILNIIETHIKDKWSLTVWITSFDLHDGKTIYDLSFKQYEEAVLFKLSYY